MMKVIIDRIEDGIATVELENGKMINVPCELFADCMEGDVVNITPDAQETQKRTEEIRSELKKLFDN